MIVDNAKKTAVDSGVILYFDPVLHSSKVITQMNEASRLDARQNNFWSKFLGHF